MMGLYKSIPLSLTTNHINNYDQNCVKKSDNLGIFFRGVIKKLKLKKINLKKKLEYIEFSKTKTHQYIKFYNFILQVFIF